MITAVRGRRFLTRSSMSQTTAGLRPEEMATFAVLGPVEVRAPGRASVVLPPSVRALLARLALAAGRVVSVDTLTEALWGDDLPVDTGSALQSRGVRVAAGPGRCVPPSGW